MKNPREAVFGVLTDFYDKKNSGKSWWTAKASRTYPTEVNRDLTVSILSAIVGWATAPIGPSFEDDRESELFYEVRNIIWNTWPGGGTAFNAAKRIFNELGFPTEDFKE